MPQSSPLEGMKHLSQRGRSDPCERRQQNCSRMLTVGNGRFHIRGVDRMETGSDPVKDPARLRALRATDLLDSPAEERFDRLTRLASRFLNAPVALVSLVEEDRQFFKSRVGLTEPLSSAPETPLSHSFCQHVVRSGEPLIIEDARENRVVRDNPAVSEYGAIAYLGIPLVTSDRHVLGTLCVVDDRPRHWTDHEIQALGDLAGVVLSEIELRRTVHESEERYHLIVESIRDYGIFKLSPDGQIRAWNSGAERITGYERDEALGRHASLLYRTEDVAAGDPESELAEALTKGRAERDGWLLRKDGSAFWAHQVLTTVRNPDGSLRGLVKVTQDLTEQRRAAEREKEMIREQAAQIADAVAQRQIRDIVESITDAFFAFDDQWRLTYVNRNGEGLLQTPKRSLLGSNVWDLYPSLENTSTQAALLRAADERIPMDVEFPSLVTSGKWFHCHVAPTSDGVAVYVRDITDRKRAEEAMQAARKEAEAASRAKSEFLGRMSHELRTPLNAILGFGQLLQMDVESEENAESVELILRAGRHLLVLIDEVLDLSRIEARAMSLSVEPVCVGDVVRQSLELVRHMATERGIAVTSIPESAAQRRVHADLQRLKQVILNLLSNAIKYNRPGGSVGVSCDETENATLRIVVSDTGHGIPEEKLGRLFVPFERLDAEQSSVEGTGLGLALSRGLMEAMGGSLGVESRAGEGSRFWAELPLVVEAGPTQPEAQDGGPAAGGEAEPTKTVLVIEDNLANVRLLERIFGRRPQVRLLVAMQGSIGLELAREHRPGLILLDLNLPGISGREVLRELRNDPALRDVPVIMVSGDGTPERVQRLKEEGAHGYITKPFNVSEVLRLVDATLDTGPAAPQS